MDDATTLLWPARLPAWRAAWIAPAGMAAVRNAAFDVRRTVGLDEPSPDAVLHVAAESRYRLYVNGVEVGVGPVRGTAAVSFVDSYRVGGLLRPGENRIAVRVQSPNVATFRAAPVQPAVTVQLDDGALLVSDESWSSRALPGWRTDVDEFTFQIGDMEWYDLGADEPGWPTGTDPRGWAPAARVEVGKRLLARDIPALAQRRHRPASVPVACTVPAGVGESAVADRMHTEPHGPAVPLPLGELCAAAGEPVVLRPDPDGRGVGLLVDFGREINGAVEVDLSCTGRAVLDLGYAEQRTAAGRIATVAGEYRFADRYLLGPGRRTVTTLFGERGFRTVQLTVRDLDGEVRLHAVRGVDRRYPFTVRGRFASSDPLLDRIWAISVETLRACATDTFVDCPWRENAFYLNDLLVESAGALRVFGDPRLTARCLRLAMSQARPDGLLPAPVPYGLVPGMTAAASADRLVFPAANLALPLIAADHLAHSGDTRLAAEVYERLPAIFATIDGWAGSDGVITPPAEHWNFVDWSYELAGRCLDGRASAALNWLAVLGRQAAAGLARTLGRYSDARRWSRDARRQAAATHRAFFDADRHRYADWPIHRAGAPESGTDAGSGRGTDSGPEAGSAGRGGTGRPEAGSARRGGTGRPEAGGPEASRLVQALALLAGTDLAPPGALAAALHADDLLQPELYGQSFVLRALAASGQQTAAVEQVRRLWGPVARSGSPTVFEFAVAAYGASAMDDRGSLCHGFSTAPIELLQDTVLGVRPGPAGFTRFAISPHLAGLAHAAGSVPTPYGDIEVAWRAQRGGVQGSVDVPAGLVGVLPDGRELGAGRHDVRLD